MRTVKSEREERAETMGLEGELFVFAEIEIEIEIGLDGTNLMKIALPLNLTAFWTVGRMDVNLTILHCSQVC